MAFDVDVTWESDIEAGMDVVPAMGLPAEGLARVRFDPTSSSAAPCAC